MEAKKRILRKVGPPVENEEFYGREKELNLAWNEYILKGTSLLLSAPRRVGKSSFSKKMLKKAEDNGWQVMYLDLQGISTESEFVRLFKETLQKENWWEKTKSQIGNTIINLFNSIEEVNVLGNEVSISGKAWRNDTYSKIKQLIESTDNILIVVDELTVFLNHLLTKENGKEKVEFFLEWLRKFRQVSNTKVRWIICSSVGIDNFAYMHQLSRHLNDFYRLEIGAFSENEAKDFISRLDVGDRIQFSEMEIQYILEKLGWLLPYFIQLLIDKIKNLSDDCQLLSNELIESAYNHLLKENYFNTWDERLREYVDFEKTARSVLKLCAERPSGRTGEDLLRNLLVKKSTIEETEYKLARTLKLLLTDGYLMENERNYAFRSPLLRDFWHTNFIL